MNNKVQGTQIIAMKLQVHFLSVTECDSSLDLVTSIKTEISFFKLDIC